MCPQGKHIVWETRWIQGRNDPVRKEKVVAAFPQYQTGMLGPLDNASSLLAIQR